MAHSMRQMAHSRGEVATDTHAGRPSLSGRAQGIALVAVAIVLAYRPAPEITNPAELRMQPVRSASSSANDGSVMGTPHLVVTTQPDSRHNRPRRGTPTNVPGTPGSARRVSLFLSRRECPSRYGSNRRFAPGYYPWAQDAQGQLGEGRPGISIWGGPNPCGGSSGSFEVRDIARAATGDTGWTLSSPATAAVTVPAMRTSAS